MKLPSWLRTWWAFPALLGALWMIVAVGFLAAGKDVPERFVTWSWIPFNLYQLAAMTRVVLARELPWRLRRAWLVLVVANVCSLVGDSVWFVLAEAGIGNSLSYHPVGDTFYLCEYPLYALGTLLIPVTARGGLAMLALDLLTVLAAALVVVWDTIVRPALGAYESDPLAFLFEVAPSVGDVLLLAGMTAVIARRPAAATGRAVVLLAVSMLVYAVFDVGYAATAREGYLPGGVLDLGWILARVLLALAAIRQLEPPGDEVAAQRTARTLERWSIALPVGATAIGFTLIIVVFLRGPLDEGSTGTAIGAALLCVLVLARQTATAIANARLAKRLRAETDKSERLLLNILPAPIASQLKEGRPEEPLADSVDEATVLFADLVGFTQLSASTTPQRLVGLLDEVFTRFDVLAERYGLEKIKTIGDAYMAAAGVPYRRPDHAEAAARMALAMNDALASVAKARGVDLALRIGLHSGTLVAGVIGQRKFSYDLWGDTVNTASRMESHGAPGMVHVSEAVHARLGDARWRFEPRGELEVKGKGRMPTWFLLGERLANAAA